MHRMGKHEQIAFGTYTLCGTVKPSDIQIQKPILWRVLHREGSKALLISEYCLDWDLYDGSDQSWGAGGDITWAASDMREYLNHQFYEESFTMDEKKRILMTVVQTPDNLAFHTHGGATVEDAIFLLSVEEVQKYFGPAVGMTENDAQAQIMMADRSLSEENGVAIDKYPQMWWLRTPGAGQNQVACVDEDGRIDLEGINCNADEVGIRPAMWVELEN